MVKNSLSNIEGAASVPGQRDFPDGPVVKNLLCNSGDVGLIPGMGTKISHVVWCHKKMKEKKRITKTKSIPDQGTKIPYVFQQEKNKKAQKNIVADSRLKMSIL